MYVLFGGMVLVMVLVLGNLLMFLFSSSVILDLSSRRCWVVVVCLGGLFGRSAEGADGNRMSTWNGSIGAGLAGFRWYHRLGIAMVCLAGVLKVGLSVVHRLDVGPWCNVLACLHGVWVQRSVWAGSCGDGPQRSCLVGSCGWCDGLGVGRWSR